MKVNIAMPVFRRPEYTKQVLEAVEAYLPKEWSIYVSVDRDKNGNANQNVVDVFKDSRAVVNISPLPNGCNNNVFNALSLAWANNPDAVVCIEDDILVQPLSGQYLKWALSTFQNDKKVRSINLWEPANPPIGNPDKNAVMLEANNFSCWGWATWAREWEGIKVNWTTGSDHASTSWDVVLEKYWKNRYEVAPIYSLVTNIGEELGTHRGAAQPSRLANWSEPKYFWLDESLTVHPQKKVFVILGAFGDIYMVAKEVPEDSIIACSPEYASILYELFPDIEVYEIEGVDRNKLKDAMAICAYKYPTRDIILAQQDGEGTDVVKPYRSYEKYQISRAKL